ncbi:hypothetical protein [Neptunicella marina]|uniref:Uncharacterized protein n=1 Tax=Neptunicella marina TaxID=2125989 RepID=A0A8J6M0N7_9ALTE|nr:hypothetical protein [Neptunicella marina]MBC3767319.1 hypothetical protein [Neptunicella marina]
MTKLDKDQVVEKFTKAYKAANGKAPQIEAKGGWYSVDGGKNMRLAQLDELADELAGGAAKAETSAPAEKKAKVADKPAAAKKEKAPAKTKKAAAKKSSSFSVKAFWSKLLAEKDANNKNPR